MKFLHYLKTRALNSFSSNKIEDFVEKTEQTSLLIIDITSKKEMLKFEKS